MEYRRKSPISQIVRGLTSSEVSLWLSLNSFHMSHSHNLTLKMIIEGRVNEAFTYPAPFGRSQISLRSFESAYQMSRTIGSLLTGRMKVPEAVSISQELMTPSGPLIVGGAKSSNNQMKSPTSKLGQVFV